MAIQGNVVTGLGPVDELFAAVPQIPLKKTPADDGIVSTGKEGAVARATPEEEGPSYPTLDTVTDPQTKYQVVDGLARSQDKIVQNRWAIDLYHRRVRSNIPFSYLEKVPNQAVWVAKLPYGVTRERSASTPCKADDLCNKVTAAILADPAKPNPIPHINAESAEQAGKLSTQFLTELMGESGLNWSALHSWALDVALTCASSFLHYDVDPTGGGYQPKQLLAHPEAMDPANPLIGPDGQPTPDPVLRYVSAGGPPTPEAPHGTPAQFVTDAAQAERVWLPKIVCERIRREQVRLFPPTADIETAGAVILVLWSTVQDAMRRFPDTVGKMSGSQLATLASWRPSFGGDYAVPYMMRAGLADGQSGPSVEEVGSYSPLLQRRMFWYRLYIKGKTKDYPKGYWLDISGHDGGTVLQERDLEFQVTLPVGGTTMRCRDIPVEQVRPLQDIEGGDPMGWPFISRVAGTSDAEQMLYASYQDAIAARLNPHVFIRSTAAVDDEDWADRSVPIILNPSDPEPTYENFSPLPGEFLPMIDNLDAKMDSAMAVGETGQGLETNTSVSGIAKQISVQQADRNLSLMLASVNASQTRGWRICLQIAQAEFTVPQLMEYTGEDGSAETSWWTGQDFAGVDSVGIEPGTGTMRTPEGKANLVGFAQAQGWLDAKKGATIGLAGITRELGLPPDPTEQAIDRAIGVWLKGPPEGWEDEYNAYAQEQQALAPQLAEYNQLASLAQQSGQPMTAQPPQGQVPAPFTPFVPKVNDSEPRVAEMWVEKLSETMMGPEYSAQPKPWQEQLDQRYLQMRQHLQAAQMAAAQAAQPQQPQPGQAPQATGTAKAA